MKQIQVAPHDPNWRAAFDVESKLIASALGENVIAVHHIGSTSIPGIHAKPVIDILVEVNDIEQVDSRNSAMESLGYEVMREFGIPGRRYFRKDDREGTRTHQIHTFLAASDQVIRHLAFRDYLIAHPDAALEYGTLKRRLAADHPHDTDSYIAGKDPFIREIDRLAAIWRQKRRPPEE